MGPIERLQSSNPAVLAGLAGWQGCLARMLTDFRENPWALLKDCNPRFCQSGKQLAGRLDGQNANVNKAGAVGPIERLQSSVLSVREAAGRQAGWPEC